MSEQRKGDSGMSGGSLDYLYQKVDQAANEIRVRNPDSPLHHAFANHLDLVSRALHDCEWVMSCDYGEGDDEKAIRAVLAPGAELEAAIRQAEKVSDSLNALLDRQSGEPGGEAVGLPGEHSRKSRMSETTVVYIPRCTVGAAGGHLWAGRFQNGFVCDLCGLVVRDRLPNQLRSDPDG